MCEGYADARLDQVCYVARVSVCVIIRGRVMDRAGTSIWGKRGCQRDDGI